MNKRKWNKDSFVHIYNRGARGLPIVEEASDRWRFVRMLYYLNDENRPDHWERKLNRFQDGFHFQRPQDWPPREQMVDICAYCLMDNHYHLLLYERKQGGISSFMHRFATSYSNYFKKKYDETGLFEGSYKSRTVSDEEHLHALFYYINVKNPFETYPGGYDVAVNNFDAAFQHALEYPFCSLYDHHATKQKWPIIDKRRTEEYIPYDNLKETARDYLLSRNVYQLPDSSLKHILIDHQ